MPVAIDFDVLDPAFVPGMLQLQWEDMWPRSFAAGESRAYLGAFTIALITKPFTAGEDAAVVWCLVQDDCSLIGCYHMADGRDFMLLERHHTKQSRFEAITEQRTHVAKKLREIGLDPVSG